MTKPICAVDGCERPSRRRQWCNPHYERWQRYGDPLGGFLFDRYEPLEVQFANRTPNRPEIGCWIWDGAYQTKIPGRNYGALGKHGAHVVSWMVHFGPVPPGMEVCHRCDNPPCVRPDHLFLGTHAENLADMAAKGRSNKVQRKLSLEQQAEIKARYAAGEPQPSLARAFGVGQSSISRYLTAPKE